MKRFKKLFILLIKMNEQNNGRRGDEPRVEDIVRNDFPNDATVEERGGAIYATDGSFKILYPNKRENPDGSVTVEDVLQEGILMELSQGRLGLNWLGIETKDTGSREEKNNILVKLNLLHL